MFGYEDNAIILHFELPSCVCREMLSVVKLFSVEWLSFIGLCHFVFAACFSTTQSKDAQLKLPCWAHSSVFPLVCVNIWHVHQDKCTFQCTIFTYVCVCVCISSSHWGPSSVALTCSAPAQPDWWQSPAQWRRVWRYSIMFSLFFCFQILKSLISCFPECIKVTVTSSFFPQTSWRTWKRSARSTAQWFLCSSPKRIQEKDRLDRCSINHESSKMFHINWKHNKWKDIISVRTLVTHRNPRFYDYRLCPLRVVVLGFIPLHMWKG